MLRFDNLGLGDPEGDWGDGSFSLVLHAARIISAWADPYLT